MVEGPAVLSGGAVSETSCNVIAGQKGRQNDDGLVCRHFGAHHTHHPPQPRTATIFKVGFLNCYHPPFGHVNEYSITRDQMPATPSASAERDGDTLRRARERERERERERDGEVRQRDLNSEGERD